MVGSSRKPGGGRRHALSQGRIGDKACKTGEVNHYAAEVWRSEEHTSELQSRLHLVCRLLLEKKTENSPSFSVFSSWQMNSTFCDGLRIEEILPVNVPSTRWPLAKVNPLPLWSPGALVADGYP